MGPIALAVSILGGLSFVVGAGAVAYWSMRSAKDQANMRSWERAVQSRDDEIAGLRLDVTRHEATITAMDATIRAHEVTIARQAEEIVALRQERPSADEIAFIKAKLDEHAHTVSDFITKWEAEHSG